MLFLRMLLFSLLLAFIVAKLEINIEGKHGFATTLPTWRMKNKFTKLIWGNYDLTGYHLWLEELTFISLHSGFVAGLPWSIAMECALIGFFLIAVVIEDFFWFWLNPAYGFAKFDKQHATWHKEWLFGVPTFYLKLMGIGWLFLILAQIIGQATHTLLFF